MKNSTVPKRKEEIKFSITLTQSELELLQHALILAKFEIETSIDIAIMSGRNTAGLIKNELFLHKVYKRLEDAFKNWFHNKE